MLAERALLLLTLAATAVAIGALALLRGRRRVEPLPAAGTRRPAAGPGPCPAQALCTALCEALPELTGRAGAWTGFDQLVRELLHTRLGAGRVRCYRVLPGEDQLQSLAAAGRDAHAPSARTGVLGHAVTTGREYAAADRAHGPLLDDLAARTEESWEWIWPVRDGHATLGVVAVGQLADPRALTPELRRTVGQVVTLGWRHLAAREELELLRRIDPASGVLTRNEFFALARHALDDSYQGHEPVVMAVLALEGLRRLDDAGHWQVRDRLIEQVGQAIRGRVRSDDLVGRFADDRFVMLLRRLDSGLGRLICQKVLAAGAESLQGLADETGPVGLRVGLAGSGLRRPGLEGLLASAFEAVDRARKAGRALESDVE